MASPYSLRIRGLENLNPRRILCCQLRQIGDVLLMTPSLRMLKRRYPDAQVDVYTEAKCAPVLEHNPDIHRIWRVDRSLGLLDALRFYRHVGTGGGQGRYDLIVDFQQLPRIRWMLMLSDAPVKLSYPPPWYNQLLYTHWARVSGPYAAKCKAAVLTNALGIPWQDDPPRLYLTGAETSQARADLAAWGFTPEDRLVTVDATSRRITRCWPAEHYGRLMALAQAARPGLRFLLFYGPGEEADVRDVRAQALAAGLPERQVVLTPRLTTLREMAAIQSLAALHLGNSSAPQHFAVGVGIKSLTIRGSTSAAWIYPGPGHADAALGLPCQPCDEAPCPRGRQCLTELSPESVLPRLLSLLDE